MAVLLAAFAAVVAIITCVIAIHPGGREISVGLVVTGVVAAGLTGWALTTLRDVARTDEGWGAFGLYALAYITLLFFLFALALNHQMG
jgi:hypothetical protein